jgi:hypothetical protein
MCGGKSAKVRLRDACTVQIDGKLDRSYLLPIGSIGD